MTDQYQREPDTYPANDKEREAMIRDRQAGFAPAPTDSDDVRFLLSLLDEARKAHPKIATAAVVAGYMNARYSNAISFEECMAEAEAYAIDYTDARWPIAIPAEAAVPSSLPVPRK